MKVTVYQINMDRDRDRLCFMCYEDMQKVSGKPEPDGFAYDKIYEGLLPDMDLEEIYAKFNLNLPEDYKGRLLSVSDIVRVEDSAHVKDGFYYCDSIGFREIRFEPDHKNKTKEKEMDAMNVEHLREEFPIGTKIKLISMDGERQMNPGMKGEVTGVDDAGQIHMEWENGSTLALNTEVDLFEKLEAPEKISVLLVKPHRYPSVVQIDDSLESMQAVVGGMIEEYMPFEDDVAIICNEEGKISGMDLNRAIYDEDHHVVDVIAGDFFVTYAPPESENFKSLPKELEKKYAELFKYPEQFFRNDSGIYAIPYTLSSREQER